MTTKSLGFFVTFSSVVILSCGDRASVNVNILYSTDSSISSATATEAADAVGAAEAVEAADAAVAETTGAAEAAEAAPEVGVSSNDDNIIKEDGAGNDTGGGDVISDNGNEDASGDVTVTDNGSGDVSVDVSGSADVGGNDVVVDSGNNDVVNEVSADAGGSGDIGGDTTVQSQDVGAQDQDAVADIAVEVPCIPDCEGKECGDDGCGGSCGECNGMEICWFGECVLKYSVECTSALCLFYDNFSQVVIAAGMMFGFYQSVIFFTGMENVPYPNIETPGIIDNENFVTYFPVPKEKVYKLFTLKSFTAWLLIDGKTTPFLGAGLEYYCTSGGCAILISERK